MIQRFRSTFVFVLYRKIDSISPIKIFNTLQQVWKTQTRTHSHQLQTPCTAFNPKRPTDSPQSPRPALITPHAPSPAFLSNTSTPVPGASTSTTPPPPSTTRSSPSQAAATSGCSLRGFGGGADVTTTRTVGVAENCPFCARDVAALCARRSDRFSAGMRRRRSLTHLERMRRARLGLWGKGKILRRLWSNVFGFGLSNWEERKISLLPGPSLDVLVLGVN